MATLTGKITDVTGKSPETISSISVKAPSVRIGSGSGVVASSPATVDFNQSTGSVTIDGLTGGLSWLFIEGDGWSDSIALSVAEGMSTLVEAIANAAGTPGFVDYIKLINNAESAIQDFINGLEVDTYGGFHASSVDIDTLLAGGTNSNSRVYYHMGSGGSTPDGGAGVLDVTNTGYHFTQVFYSTTNNTVWQRSITDRSHVVAGQWIYGDWKALNNYPALPEPELLSLNHTMTGTGGSSPIEWVSFSPAPPGWVSHNRMPEGEYIFTLSTDSPNADFTLTFRSEGAGSPVVLTRTGNRNSPVTVRVKNPGVGSYSVHHNSPGATLTMRVIGEIGNPTPQVVAIDTDGTPYATTSSGTHYVLTDERGPYVAATITRSLQFSTDGTPTIK